MILRNALLFFFLPLCAEIQIVYHIATMTNWKAIVKEQLALVQDSGLADACDRITVVVVGPKIKRARQLIQELIPGNKVRIIHGGKELDQYEFPSIAAARNIAQNSPNAKILYLHTKGVSHYRTPFEENVAYWRCYLNYFVIEKWRACVEALDSFDLCGVDWLEKPELHFSGNFWWSRADYLRTCQGTAKRHGRWDSEYLIGSGNSPRAKSFHQSGRDLYHFAYLPSYYR